MVLSDKGIMELLSVEKPNNDEERIVVTPVQDIVTQLQPASFDITLGKSFLTMEDATQCVSIQPEDEQIKYRQILCNSNTRSYYLGPGDFCLATTQEYLCLPNGYAAFVEGRSSIGRMGLFIQNAGWIDPGFEGEITLELFNANRYTTIELVPGTRVGQIVFLKMDQPAMHPYRGKYQGQRFATGSRIHEDTKKY